MMHNHNKKASDADECARAAGIYECGKTKAPALTDAIQNKLISDRATPATVNNNTLTHIFIS